MQPNGLNTFKYELLSAKSIAKTLNDRIYTDYYIRLMLIARSLFKWNNLPNGLDEKWIERYLFNDGSCIFYHDPELGFMVAGTGYNGQLNVYNEPTRLLPIAPHYVYTGEQLMNNKNAVIIRNNDDMVPTAPTIQLYAMKIANIDRTIDTNVIAQKMPLIIKCSNKQLATLKQVIRQRDDNEVAIFGDKNLDTDEIKILNTEAPIVFDKLEIQKHMVYNECMTFLGVNNANMDKRERVVTDEVSANDQQVKANEDVMLKARQRACDLINDIFGAQLKDKVTVERRRLSDTDMYELDPDEEIKIVENEENE